MIQFALLFVRKPRDIFSKVIVAQDGGLASHVGVRIGDEVVDATFWHGVKTWKLEDWMAQYELVESVDFVARNSDAEAAAARQVTSMLGKRYDWLEILGFLLWRDLGSPNRPVCSRLAQDVFNLATGVAYPGRSGRWGVRLCQVSATSYRQGLKNSGATAA